MSKRPSLTDTMKAVQQAKPTPLPSEAPAPAATPKSTPPSMEPKPYFAATREGLKRVTFGLVPAEHRRLKRLSADTGRNIEDIMREALADLFAKLA